MAPPTAIEPPQEGTEPTNYVPHEPGISKNQAAKKIAIEGIIPKFTDKHEERKFLKGRLTTALRIFGKLGFEEGVAGHITVRDPVEPDTFWVNPFGVAFRLMRQSDLIRVNSAGDIVEGGEHKVLNTAAYMIHHAVHAARPDVICAAHSHSLYGRAFCTLGYDLDMITQDACAFYNDLARYEAFNGVVLAEQEGKDIATCLGGKKAALLQNHGLLTVGHSVEEAVFWFMSLEKCCHAQLLADAAAAGRGRKTVKINEEDAAFTYQTVGSHLAGWFSAKPEFDVMMREQGQEILS